jgi:hypothetical protein
MSFFSFLKKKSVQFRQTPQKQQQPRIKHSDRPIKNGQGKKEKKYLENDNVGTRIDTEKKSKSWIEAWELQGKPLISTIYYSFTEKSDAYSAMLEIPCIKRADDTKQLICTEVLQFGVYLDSNSNRWIACLMGSTLTSQTFNKAKKSFQKYNGQELSSIKPNQHAAEPFSPQASKGSEDDVKFSCEIDLSKRGGVGIKKIYKAPNKTIALEFLKRKQIDEAFFYIEIETPEGWVGKDKDGIYDF